MINKNGITPRKYIDTFYSLFSSYENEYFVGSLEQMRLLLQLKLKYFIPPSLVSLTLTNFINSNIILDTKKYIEIEKKIGERFFPNYRQKVYQKNPNTTGQDLQKLEFVFSNIDIKVRELTTKKDVKRLHDLEKEKGITVQELFRIKEIDDDLGYLYDTPRSKVLEYIERLSNYSPKYKEDNELMKQQLQWEIDILHDKMATIFKNTFERNLAFEEINIIELYHNYLGKLFDVPIGKFSCTKLTWTEDNSLLIEGNEFNFKLPITDIEINYNMFRIQMYCGNLGVSFDINRQLKDHIEKFKVYEELTLDKINFLKQKLRYFL